MTFSFISPPPIKKANLSSHVTGSGGNRSAFKISLSSALPPQSTNRSMGWRLSWVLGELHVHPPASGYSPDVYIVL
ncbi:MAG: hypothetical protein LBH44_00305 [Treponema sp.]|jgi:hypothetical protein|nr:hypothetical protein [Treponema sp.]